MTQILLTLGQVSARTDWRVPAFVLMSNHYHLLVETPGANLVAGMRWFQSTYTMRSKSTAWPARPPFPRPL